MIGSTHDNSMLALSLLIAICALYAMLDLAGRTAAALAWLRLAWLVGGSVSVGLGLWLNRPVSVAGGLVMGGGLALARHIGMAAIRLPATLHWNRAESPQMLAEIRRCAEARDAVDTRFAEFEREASRLDDALSGVSRDAMV